MEKQAQRKGNWLIGALIVLCAAGALFAAYKLVTPLLEYRAGNALYLELSGAQAAPEPSAAPRDTPEPGWTPAPVSFPRPDFAALATLNPDVAAWLYAPGTVISYPVVQGKNNSYYLGRLFNGDRNKMGTLFIDANNAPGFADQNTIIYGHHMKNGSMFASLVNYKDQTYYNVNPDMWLSTPEGNYRLELFAGYVTDGHADNIVYTRNFAGTEAFLAFLEQARADSDFVSDVAVGEGDRIVTLSTCTYEYDNARYVVLGKLVPLE